LDHLAKTPGNSNYDFSWFRKLRSNRWEAPVKLRSLSALSAVLVAVAVLPSQEALTSDRPKKEEIYVIRSIRLSRDVPSEYCAAAHTGFSDPISEAKFVFHPVTTREKDGAIISTEGQKAASLHACFGKTGDPKITSFYGEGELAGASFVGKGQCTRLKADFPEMGISAWTCFLELSGLKDPYKGGGLTTNTVDSRNPLGEQSDPPGYTQPSIATVRLWRRE
jgi:hypothetical protein